MKIYFRPEINEAYGMGHIRRCILLADQLRNTGNIACFLIEEGNEKACQLVTDAGFEFFDLPSELMLKDEVSFYPEDCMTILLDLFHAGRLGSEQEINDYLSRLDDQRIKAVFIDALFNEAFRDDNCPRIPILIQPYYGAEQDIEPNTDHWLRGVDYAVMDKQFHQVSKKTIKNKAENLLLTFGGSDPQGITTNVMEAFSEDDLNLNIRVVLGPFFSDGLIGKAKKIAKKSSSAFEIIGPQETMVEQYGWADIVIGASSLSRYEFAAMGLPTIFTSIYKEHIKSSKIFASMGSSIYLGYYKDICKKDWRTSVSELKDNKELRTRMSRIGQKKVDGKGAARIINEILRILDSD